MTTIKFIGLFVLMYTQNVGYHILVPHFTGMPMDHPSFIAYQTSDRNPGADDWPVTGDVPDMPGWQYVTVDREYVTIAGATDGVPNKVEPPHLTCCCTALNSGIQNAYKDPNLSPASKKGAQVEVSRGVASLVEDQNGRLDTNVTMNTGGTNGVTVMGTLGAGSVKNIYFKPGATVIFGNTPFCALTNTCDHKGDADWVQYYSMANDRNACIGTPSNCSKCSTSGSGAPCASSTCPTLTSAKTAAAKAAAAIKKRVRTYLTVNIDCSNSQWP
jgi:hypothetical protein